MFSLIQWLCFPEGPFWNCLGGLNNKKYKKKCLVLLKHCEGSWGSEEKLEENQAKEESSCEGKWEPSKGKSCHTIKFYISKQDA